MVLRWRGRLDGGAPGRVGRLLAGTLLLICLTSLLLGMPGRVGARMDDSDQERYEATLNTLQSRVYTLYGWYHSVGQVLLHVSNLSFFGRFGVDLNNPSCEWPAGSNHEYIYAAGLWVGGIVNDHETGLRDTLVSAAVYQVEFRPNRQDLLETIYESWEGAANSTRLYDDDGDCNDHIFNAQRPFEWFDEDPYDARDNDGDGLIDEDYAAISQQMFRCLYEDTYEDDVNDNASPGDQHKSLGLRVIQESYQWTSPTTDDFAGIDFKVINIGRDTIRMAYVGFMVDADAGPDNNDLLYWQDDRGGFLDTLFVSPNPNNPALNDTLAITLGYLYDDPYGTDGNEAKGYIGCMFLGHPTVDPRSVPPGTLPPAPTEVRVHAFKIWSSGAEDPDNDVERYRMLRGRVDFPQHDGIDNDFDGDTDDPDEWLVNIDRRATPPADWRFMLSAGPFMEILPGDTLSFQYAFVLGLGLQGMLENAATAQQVYNGITQTFPRCDGQPESLSIHWVADTPPPPPYQEITAGDRFVRIEWDDYPEEIPDPLTRVKDFYGYQIWKAVGWTRESQEPRDRDWQLVLDIDKSHGGEELLQWDTGLEGIGKYCFVDSLVKNGFSYWYSVTAYDSTAEGYHFGKYTQNKTLIVPHSATSASLDGVIVVPNPYVRHRYISRWNLDPDETDPTGERICFQNLPRGAIVRIYTLGGELVTTSGANNVHFRYDPELTGGDACWDLVSRNDQIIVSGVYLYQVDSPAGQKTGKFVIIK
ncbi:MAG: hypothetical protein FJY74_02215 [Candidatus Eisenbacteria bacterium]|nr:hypothetical protein [Candidatus Eisenbacteria bacterium]